jgi:hypothetical protein
LIKNSSDYVVFHMVTEKQKSPVKTGLYTL